MKFINLHSILVMMCLSNPGWAQLTVATNTNVSVGGSTSVTINTDLINNGNMSFAGQAELILMGQGNLVSTNPFVVPILSMAGNSYNLSGQWRITENLSLQSGTITPDATAQIIMGSGAVATSENSAYINGRLYHTGTGEKFYPIGVAGSYAPVTLNSVQGAGDLLIGFQVFNNALGLTTLPDNVQVASSNWYWELDVQGTFSGSPVTLPVLSGDEVLLAGDNVQAVVLEATSDLAVRNLGNGLSSDATEVRSSEIATGPYLLLGSTLILTPVIHNIITPNNDAKNDYLVIDAVNFYADDNEVIILDRWGSEVYRKKNFRNFNDIDNPYDGSFDFLASGNYICILKYGNGQTLKQTITVLK